MESPAKDEPDGTDTSSTLNFKLPDTVNIMKFAQARAQEIAAVMDLVAKKAPKKASQQVPRHMRRRASSHNPKRVPKRLRERAIRELEANKVKTTKRPSRKHRRRPKNLLAEYNRRKRTHKWLETHIWFAKRFKMKELWGYKVALHSNDKSYRVNYRASVQHCLLHDLSYYGCIELKGPEDKLIEGLSTLTSPDVGLTFKAKAFLNGDREGHTMLYHQNAYPFHPIGPASFLWKPMTSGGTENGGRYLWVWVHPLMYDELVEELQNVFEFSKITHSAVSEEVNDGIDGHQPSSNGVQEDDCETFFLGKYGINMTLLRDKLARFRLTGDAAQRVLASALEPVACEKQPEGDPGSYWWKGYLALERNRTIVQKQRALWNGLGHCPTEYYPPGMVTGLVVLDPRLRIPPKKEYQSEQAEQPADDALLCPIAQTSPDMAESPIWCELVRKELSHTMMPQSQLNNLRSQYLIPGTPLDLGDKESRIPVLVIKQRSTNSPQVFNSWDIILPLGWSTAFLVALVYRGARPAGLRDLCTIANHEGHLLYPNHFPDTAGGQKTAKDRWSELIQKHLRYPPAKRPSFGKLGVVSPFYLPWQRLLSDWGGEASSVIPQEGCFVLRDKTAIRALQKAFKQDFTGRSKAARWSLLQRSVQDSLRIKGEFVSMSEVTKNLGNQVMQSLVTVRISSFGKGCVEPLSFICIPSESDLQELRADSSFSGPEEPIHSVAKIEKSKKKKKKKKTDKGSNGSEEPDKLSEPQLPVVDNIKDSCSRKVIGFVESGDYSLLHGHGVGTGFCSLAAVMHLLKSSGQLPLVLVRAQHSRKYYFGKLWPIS